MRGGLAGAVPAADLADPAVLATLVGRFRASRGAAWRPACSLWSQFYFGTLLVPALVLAVAGDDPPALGLADLGVSVCMERGVPLSFCLGSPGAAPSPGSATAAFGRLLDGHLAPLIDGLAGASALSPKLFWENAGWPLVWTLEELLRQNPRRRPAIRAMIDRDGPPPARAMLAAVRRTVCEGSPYRRRLCCLRHEVPGFTRCEDLCPLRSAIAAS